MKDVATTQRELLTRIKTEGVEAAYEASLAVCRDPKAAAPARATASATIFRVAGYFDRGAAGGAEGKQPHEMSAEELQQAIEAAQSRITERAHSIFD